ncbi:hypothetical protein [Glycocaulis sp.]
MAIAVVHLVALLAVESDLQWWPEFINRDGISISAVIFLFGTLSWMVAAQFDLTSPATPPKKKNFSGFIKQVLRFFFPPLPVLVALIVISLILYWLMSTFPEHFE